jgi:RNA polymerase sigma factor (sigma-70 family)
MGRNVLTDSYPPALHRVLSHARRLNELLRRLESDSKQKHHAVVGRAREVRLFLGGAVDEWQAGRRDEAATVDAIQGYLESVHRTVGKALGLGRRLECCRAGDWATTASTTSAGLSVALSVALSAATGGVGADATQRRTWNDSTEVLARFRAELGLVEQEARALARRMPAHRASVEELRAFGFEGLLDAARRFDVARGVPFAHWARQRIHDAMVGGVRATAGVARDPHVVAVALGEPTPAPSLERVVGDAEELAMLPGLLEALPVEQRRLLERHYLGGETLAQAAAALGLPTSTASRMHGRALSALRRQLRPNDTV